MVKSATAGSAEHPQAEQGGFHAIENGQAGVAEGLAVFRIVGPRVDRDRDRLVVRVAQVGEHGGQFRPAGG